MNEDSAAPDDCEPAEEIAYNGEDEDCDGADLTDVDADGWPAAVVGGEDCDDGDPAVSPDAREVCANLRDDDCDGRTDEGCALEDAGPPDPGGLYWICGVTSPGSGWIVLISFMFVGARRRLWRRR